MRTKDEVRREVWRGMGPGGGARVPGAQGRVPNFAGAEGAAAPLPRPTARGHAPGRKAHPHAPPIKGALKHGQVTALDQVPELALVLPGSVAVNLKGARRGKGGGFSALEYGRLSEGGRIARHTQVATTVHPIQILRENLLMTG